MSLLSAVEEFSPQTSLNPADFSDSDRDEREEEEPLGFGLQLAVLHSFPPVSLSVTWLTEPRKSPRPSWTGLNHGFNEGFGLTERSFSCLLTGQQQNYQQTHLSFSPSFLPLSVPPCLEADLASPRDMVCPWAGL